MTSLTPPPFRTSISRRGPGLRRGPSASALLALIAAGALAAGAATPAPKLPAQVAALAWMAGAWSGTAAGVEMEEVWLPPKGGALLGLHRDLRAGAMVSFEFLRIAETDGGSVYYGSPRGAAPTAFTLVESGDRRAVFANPDHDYPQRILYWLDPTGALHARVEGAGGADPEEWTWRPAPPRAP